MEYRASENVTPGSGGGGTLHFCDTKEFTRKDSLVIPKPTLECSD